jgi:hypothetical protein
MPSIITQQLSSAISRVGDLALRPRWLPGRATYASSKPDDLGFRAYMTQIHLAQKPGECSNDMGFHLHMMWSLKETHLHEGLFHVQVFCLLVLASFSFTVNVDNLPSL